MRVAAKNGPPAVLFEAVRTWLLDCVFAPSRDKSSGKPVAVKIFQPFVFRLR